jgi:hypothetical protein
VQIFDGDVCTVLEVAEGLGEGLGTCAWVRVCKAGVGEGWLSTNNVHIQGHGYAPAVGAPAPPVPGINPLGRPLPPEWQQPQAENLHLAAVEPGSAEWVRLESRLRATVPSATLRRVERIQNVRLYASFDVQMTMLQNDLGGERPTVQELFHGTGRTPPHMIYNGQEGFDMRFCDQGLWGKASYFAVEAAYSNTDKYCYKNERGERELLVADVITGRTIELPPDASLRMPPEMPSMTWARPTPGIESGAAASMPSGTRYDSVTGVGGGGGRSRIYMIYRHDRAYPKFRLTYVTDQDRRPSMHAPPTQARPPRLPIPMPLPFSSAAAVDTFALYLRPHLALGSARWAVGWQAADHLQQNWGGLHVTLCSFAPKLSSGVHGHHGGGLKETLRQVQACLSARWQLAARHGPIWYRRDHILMIQLQTAAPSKNLSGICRVVQSAGMVNPRSAADLHLTLGDTRRLPPLPGGAAFPAEGANEPLPPELAADLYEAHWALSVAKLPGGSCPATDNEVVPL